METTQQPPYIKYDKYIEDLGGINNYKLRAMLPATIAHLFSISEDDPSFSTIPNHLWETRHVSMKNLIAQIAFPGFTWTKIDTINTLKRLAGLLVLKEQNATV